MRGRKPKPTKLKQLAGNPGKRPLNEHEPATIPGRPEPPSHLLGEARDEWYRMVERLERMGILSQTDVPSLVAYCEAWANYVEVKTQLKQVGRLIKTPNGHVQSNPLVSQFNQLDNALRRWLVEFGLTPSSRSRIHVENKSEENSGKSRFFQNLTGEWNRN